MEELALRMSGIETLGVRESLHLGLLGRLVLAALLGAAVGWERERSDKPAGLRTNVLICVGAALISEVSIAFARLPGPEGTVADPGRIAAQIVSGIGFLGAGTIIQARGQVTGLTTAATLWVVAAIGMAVGGRAYVEAVGATVLVLVVLVPMGFIEAKIEARRTRRVFLLSIRSGEGAMESLRTTLEELGLEFNVLSVERLADGERVRVRLSVRGSESAFQKTWTHLVDLPHLETIERDSW